MKGKREKEKKIDIPFLIYCICIVFQMYSLAILHECIVGSIFLFLNLLMTFTYKEQSKFYEGLSDNHWDMFIRQLHRNLDLETINCKLRSDISKIKLMEVNTKCPNTRVKKETNKHNGKTINQKS